MKLILALLGYVKIPTAVVRLSIEQELFINKMIKHETTEEGIKYLERHLEGQKILTQFLRSGRQLGK